MYIVYSVAIVMRPCIQIKLCGVKNVALKLLWVRAGKGYVTSDFEHEIPTFEFFSKFQINSRSSWNSFETRTLPKTAGNDVEA
jgi:hypothetical protein